MLQLQRAWLMSNAFSGDQALDDRAHETQINPPASGNTGR